MPRGKHLLYESGIRVPLIAWFPERFRPAGGQPGTVRADLVSLIDVTATSLALAGIGIPKNMHGRPLFGPRAKPRDAIFAARERCDETVDRIRAVRTARWKSIRNFMPERPYTQQNVYKDTQYPPLQLLRQLRDEGKLTGAAAEFMSTRRPPEELYDLEADPHELRNLAASPSHAKTLAALRARLETWMRETGDQGARPEAGVEEQDRYRIEIDGWCLRQSQSPISRSAGGLKVECAPKGDQLVRSWVAPAGRFAVRFAVRFRARSKGVILDADGSALYNLYTEFDITPKTVNFALGTASTEVLLNPSGVSSGKGTRRRLAGRLCGAVCAARRPARSARAWRRGRDRRRALQGLRHRG
jgi:hypothetical protein